MAIFPGWGGKAAWRWALSSGEACIGRWRRRRDERGERDGRGKRGERDDRGEAMAKRCVLQGRQVHGGVILSVGERTRAANRNQDQNP